MFDFLVLKYSELDTQDDEGQTPLHIAARNVGRKNKNARYFINQLVCRGTDKTLQNKREQRPIDLVSDRYGHIKEQLS